MSVFYSAQTGGFYDSLIHGKNMPGDVVMITPDWHQELLEAQSVGKWIRADEEGFPVAINPPQATLDELKAEARMKINAVRDRKEQGGFAYLGKIFDSDPVSVDRIQGAAQAASFAVMGGKAEDFSISWTCQDNSIITLDAFQMMGAVSALMLHAAAVHAQANALKEAVMAADSVEAIDAVLTDSWLAVIESHTV